MLSIKILFETQHLLNILFLYPATSNSLSILSEQGHDVIKITVDSCVTFVRGFVFSGGGYEYWSFWM